MGRTGGNVLSSFIDAIGWDEVKNQLLQWAIRHESRYVAICNVHSVVTASKNFIFQQVVNEADMATPDGAPVAWMLRRLGFSGQPRINGPDLMWLLIAQAEHLAIPLYFYGSTGDTLQMLRGVLQRSFPDAVIAGMESPPFRALTSDEDTAVVSRINASRAGIVFVGLGCPKQELWMSEHRGRINAVMIGVGAAFDYHAGSIRRAPLWMQNIGLEWLHRLFSEPRRLWKRYLVTNTLFVYGVAKQLLFGNTR